MGPMRKVGGVFLASGGFDGSMWTRDTETQSQKKDLISPPEERVDRQIRDGYSFIHI